MKLSRGALTLVFCLLCPGLTFAASSDNKRTELKQQQEALRNQIGALQKDLSKDEASKLDVAAQLRQAESSISTANRKLRELSDNRAAIETQLAGLERQSQQLAAQIDNQQEQLSHLLYQQFVHGNDDALHLLLSGEDPNQTARNRYFLTLLSREKADLLGDMRNSLQQKKHLADATRDKSNELATIEKEQQQQRAALLARQQERQSLLASIAGRIKARQKQIDTLKGNEKRLGKLIDDLVRQASKPKTKHRGLATEPTPKRGKTVREPDLSTASGVFASLRGKLQLPVRGVIAGRFGAQRGDTGTTWKGLFIRAAEGSDVHAVADGTVVYADWLRGFGNLLIIDHGDGFLSVYGNNQSLLRETGKTVKAGETIAAVGSSSGVDESGLYFELRRQGQPFDPLRWISLK